MKIFRNWTQYAIFCIALIVVCAAITKSCVAQAFVLGPAQTSLSGCSWPAWATVTNGVAICPVDINGQIALALGMNQGPFVLQSAGNGVPSVFGRTGPIVAQTGDYSVSQVTGAAPITTVVKVGSKLTCAPEPGKTIASGFTCTVTAIQY